MSSSAGSKIDLKKRFSTALSPDLVACLLLLAMLLYFSHEMVWGGKVPFFRDLGPYFYPMRFSMAESFREGELPFWDRHVAMGFPLLANFQCGSFYPLHLLYLVMPFFGATRAIFMAHYLIAAIGSYRLCRQWSYPLHIALIGAILFTLGGMTVSLTNLLNHFQTAAWLPWILLWGERCLLSPSRRNFLSLTTVLLVQFLAGSPEIYAMSLGLFFLDALRLKADVPDLSYRRLFFVPLAANLVVAGLGMVQIAPTVELLLQSWRSEAIPYAKATAWSLHPLGLMNLFFLDKEVNLYVFNGLHLFFAQEPPLILSLYLGAISLCGLSLWFLSASLREKGLLLGLLIFFAIMAMGNQTPAYLYLHRYVPLVALVRFPEKFLFMVSALVLFIQLTGLFRFLRPDTSWRKGTWIALGLPLASILLVYVWLRFHVDGLIEFVARARMSPTIDVSTLMITSTALVNVERQIALTLAISLLLFLWKVGKLRSSVLGVLLVGVVFIDLTSAHRPYQFLLEPKLVYQNPRIIPAPDPEPYRLFYVFRPSDLHPNAYAFTKRPFHETVSSVYATLIPNTGVFYGFDYMQELDALGTKPYHLFLKVAQKLPAERLYLLLGTLNVKYVNSFRALPEGAVTPIGSFPEYPAWLYRINRVIPRTYIVSKVIVEEDPLKTLDRLSSAEFDPLTEVVLEQALPVSANKDFDSQAKLLRYTNHHVTIQASLNRPGILVLADSFYPGWRAYVDGKEGKILRANLFFRGVLLPPGNHRVVFRYEPASFRYGLIITVATFLLLLIFIRDRLARRKGVLDG